MLTFARAARAANAKRFVVVSAVGANPDSKNFYLRTKGEMEQQLEGLGFESLDILQPSMLLGWRREMRPLELIGIALMPLVNPLLGGNYAVYRGISATHGRQGDARGDALGPSRPAALHLGGHRGAVARHVLRGRARHRLPRQPPARARRLRCAIACARASRSPSSCARCPAPAAWSARAPRQVRPARAPQPHLPARPAPAAGSAATELPAAEQLEQGTAIATAASALIGTPYHFGGADAGGFDCSGLALYVHERVGLSIPRTAAEQQHAARPVPLAQILPGDLVFFRIRKRGIDHVGIYTGAGHFVHAPHAGVSVSSADLTGGYYARHIISAGRFWEQAAPPR